MVHARFDNIEAEILRLIDAAESEISVAMYWFTNQRLFKKLCEKAANNVTVTLLIHHDYVNLRQNGLPLDRLIKSTDGRLYVSTTTTLMHNKFCVVDRKHVVTGSYNWTYGAEKNRENVVIIAGDTIAEAFIGEFEKLLEHANPITDASSIVIPTLPNSCSESEKMFLASEILYSASDLKEPRLKELAYSTVTHRDDKFQLHQLAVGVGLEPKSVLRADIGYSSKASDFTSAIWAGSMLPQQSAQIPLVTIQTGQQGIRTDIRWREQGATLYHEIDWVSITKLPALPVGKAVCFLHISIDLNGRVSAALSSPSRGTAGRWSFSAVQLPSAALQIIEA